MIKITDEELTEEQKKAAAEALKKEGSDKDGKNKNSPAGEKKIQEGKSVLQQSKEVLEQITEQNKIMGENLKKAEALTGEQLLGGHTPAGNEPPEKTQDDKDDEAAARLSGGLLPKGEESK